MSRAELVAALAARIASIDRPHPVRVAIDGVDATGKTTLADELAPAVRERGRPVVRASVDDFHRPRAERYRAGRHSPDGYFRDSFDDRALEGALLAPLGPGGARRVRTRVFDYRTDAPVDEPERAVEPDAVLLFDGIFLQRPALRRHFDLVIFLDVPFDVTRARMVARDGVSPSPDDPSLHRWQGGQRIYLETCDPIGCADVVIDNRDVAAPRLVRGALV